jgi:hypothetical protein
MIKPEQLVGQKEVEAIFDYLDECGRMIKPEQLTG